MTSPQLTSTPPPLTEERLTLLAKMARLEQEVQEEGGFTWQELRDKYEKETADLLPKQ